MRNAPSVQYPVGRSRFYAGLLTGLGLLALVVLLVWWWPVLSRVASGTFAAGSNRTETLTGGLGGLLWLTWSLFAIFSWRRSPTGVLQWDALAVQDPEKAKGGGQGLWRWHSSAYRGGTPLQQVSLALDLQSRMLLRLRNNDAVYSWVWVEHSTDPGRWSDLRRALVSTRA